MKTVFAAALVAPFAFVCTPSSADVLEDFKDHVSNDWDQSKRAFADGNWTLYLTGFTWHLPYAYDDELRHAENSEAWGTPSSKSWAHSFPASGAATAISRSSSGA
ncbi:MAG TPA: hypothetical protein VEV20_09440 [Burkholderiales bacterium]|nr:hypothetical protein [Burkholderiales bacterium]